MFCLDIGADPVDNGGMFVREKIARGHRYLYLVESVREGGRVRQRTIRALGRKDALHASGELDRLIASLARHSERAMVLSDMEAGRLACTRIGGPLLFGRLWERLGLGAVVNELVEGRGFEFALERAVFVSVLHRLFVSGSDRSCEKWMRAAASQPSSSPRSARRCRSISASTSTAVSIRSSLASRRCGPTRAGPCAA